MPHADQLILASRDAPRDPGTQLFLEDHLRSCAECRHLQRQVERVDGLIGSPGPAAQVVPDREVRIRGPIGRTAIALVAVLLVVVGVLAGAGIRAFRESGSAPQVAAPGGPSAPALPPDWQLVIEQDLLIPLPPGWRKTLDEIGKSDPPEPDPPRILYFEDPSSDRADGARSLAIWIWPHPSLERLVQERFVAGNLSRVSDGPFASWRPAWEVIAVANWSDARGAGSDLGRSLFVQADPGRVVMVSVVGPQVPATRTQPTAEMRQIQEHVIGHIAVLRDTNRAFAPAEARAAIDRAVPLSARPAVTPGTGASGPIEWSVQARSDSYVRVVTYASAGIRRGAAGPDPSTLPAPLSSIATPRGIGDLVVWAVSPDANIRYAIVTALDALLETGVAASPVSTPRLATGLDGACPRTRTADGSGVITADGVIGIVGDTQMSSTAFNDWFVMVRRGAELGDRASVQFTQIGSSAPATWVAYGVGAEPARTPWGDVAFRLGVKPIAFANSCWRLIVNGSDSGIVFFIGP